MAWIVPWKYFELSGLNVTGPKWQHRSHSCELVGFKLREHRGVPAPTLKDTGQRDST